MRLLKEEFTQAFELFDKGYLVEAEVLYRECLSKISDTNSDEYLQGLHGLGYVKVALHRFDEARSHYNELIKIALSNEDKVNHCIAIHQLGMVERMAEKFDEALKLFQSEADFLEKYKIESALNWSANFYERGYVNLKMKNLKKAEQLMEESLHYAKKSGDDICIGCAYRGFGEIYQAKGNDVLEKQSFQNAKKAFERASDNLAIKEIDMLLRK
ncbi:tetratricopeptide repeat protein [Alkalibacterium olivapovliticus]|uniref:Tetratricopeptide repeat protein n=1 Tax=Alkalibacterium olivapovliticus TaxID=99907 RepID=A0A2T0W5R7_9LACT|nr:tetratricopeptide repeat protein [Alkalibacterium olivapovliticus]PRY81415.1 tetratricopeptide repeat protein [Alkalibacterium olivapovliticus]